MRHDIVSFFDIDFEILNDFRAVYKDVKHFVRK